MKNKHSLVSRAAVVAIAAGTLCFANHSVAQGERAAQGATQEAESSMAGVGQKPRVPRPGTTPAPAANVKASGGQLDSKDRDFMMTAAKGGMMEVHMGQMAAKQGQSAEVKKLGGVIAADHSKANSQLMGLAASKGVKLDTRHKMDKISGDNFDQEWLAQMVTSHQKTIAAFEAEAKGGVDPAVKDWAAKTLPTLKKHLKMVQDAQSKMKKAG